SEEAIAVARASGDPYQLGAALSSACLTLGLSGDDARGVELADEAVATARSLGNDNLLALAVRAAGILRSRIDPATAIDLLAQSFVLPGNQPRRGSGIGHTWKAIAHLRLRQYAAAASELCIGLPLVQDGGERYQQAIALVVAASVLSRPQPEVAV